MKITKKTIKKWLADSNESSYQLVGDKWLSDHDRCHLAVAELPRIQMGDAMVSGIAGVCIPEFGTEGNVPEYLDLLDECRVALHQVMTKVTPCSLVRARYWCLWMTTRGINPLAVVIRHIKSMKGGSI